MAEIIMNLDNITVSLGGRDIFVGLCWEVQDKQRIGLVGPNGAGKSTLMKLIAQELTQDVGQVFRVSGLTWARLEQEPVMDNERTILQEALMARPQIALLETQLDALAAKMGEPEVYGNPTTLERIIKQQDRLLVEYEQLDGTRYTSQVKDALNRAGFDQPWWHVPVRHLSGGQKKLVLLAKLMVLRPRLLLLDEPDNHLDIPAKRNLERLINSYDGCVILISHDRYLLDGVATHIAELEAGKLNLYQGNYTAYTTERQLRRLRQQQLYAAQQKEIARIEAAIARFELWASLVVNERHIRQARSRQKMLDKMDKIEKVNEARRMSLDLAGWRGSNKVVELVDVGKILPNDRVLWNSLNHTIWHGERVGLVGPNGAGKSMLLKQLLDPEGVEFGEIKIGPSSQIGYYAQEHDTLNYERILLDEIRQTAPLSENVAVSFLQRFLFTYGQIRGRVADLSGGEKSRLQLAKLVLARPNLLLLDEPTNNLDISSIEVLEETLEEFVGTVIVISHDRYFLDKVVDRVIELRDGSLREFKGGYTDYIEAMGSEKLSY
ncbi:MAG: ABC-F family ATP-binding cassette domain-containing protein [Chloroflexi bacterium]|nr:ABC-F family ATP-binding cassette domain-containing protein [Chloroflexota bacterium]MBP8058012.1 ABC-F family ATP-binding cassette domain-containing protein [Chloroflexota bacterium]